MANQLEFASSTYLRQHADNPVDWLPWGDEANVLAGATGRPILLSIGYSACHWCHVMAHESFEDDLTARFINAHFVPVKVDREERPDVDAIYMDAVMSMHGHGGWPLTLFLTPEGLPFYGGTYFPKEPSHGLPSFMQLLRSVSEAWQDRRDELERSAGSIRDLLSTRNHNIATESRISEGLLEDAFQLVLQQHDRIYGGFGPAPKFPSSEVLNFLLARFRASGSKLALEVVDRSLEGMIRGGIFDQLGGGFARYSTDANWLVPHFEKMLYDNALLAETMVQAWRLTGKEGYRRAVVQTLDWMTLALRHPSGGFYSSMDADSDGAEGAYYVWDSHAVDQLLGPNAPLFKSRFGVKEDGNWEGVNVLHIATPIEELGRRFGLPESDVLARLAEARAALLEQRLTRKQPTVDSKVLASWNGLAIKAFADAGVHFGRPDYVARAADCAEFVLTTMRDHSGRLFHSWSEIGGAALNGYLEDYSLLADGLLSLYDATFDSRWFDAAADLSGYAIAHFAGQEGGIFFDTSDDHEELLIRPRKIEDGATPSGSSSLAFLLLRLGHLSGDMSHIELARKSVERVGKLFSTHPLSVGRWLVTAEALISDPIEVALIGVVGSEELSRMISAVRSALSPWDVLAVGDETAHDNSSVPLLRGRSMIDGKATAYICRGHHCELPVVEIELALSLIGDQKRGIDKE